MTRSLAEKGTVLPSVMVPSAAIWLPVVVSEVLGGKAVEGSCSFRWVLSITNTR